MDERLHSGLIQPPCLNMESWMAGQKICPIIGCYTGKNGYSRLSQAGLQSAPALGGTGKNQQLQEGFLLSV